MQPKTVVCRNFFHSKKDNVTYFQKKNPIIWIFCITGWLAVPNNTDKWSSTMFTMRQAIVPQLIKPPVPLFWVLCLVALDILGLAQITDWATGESGFHIRQGCKLVSSSKRQNRFWQQANKPTSYELVPGILYSRAKLRTRGVIYILHYTCSLCIDKSDSQIILRTEDKIFSFV